MYKLVACVLCGNDIVCKDNICICMRCKIIHEPKMRAIFLGRFQPFHLGHVFAVNEILKECQFVTIAIGSSEKHNTQKNPFSKYEREEMIKLALKENNVPKEKYSIVFIPDIMWHERYAQHVKDHAKFNIFYASEENSTIKLFMTAGEKTMVLRKLENVSATEIREILTKAKNKKELEELKRFLPESVYQYMIYEQLDRRLKELSKA